MKKIKSLFLILIVYSLSLTFVLGESQRPPQSEKEAFYQIVNILQNIYRPIFQAKNKSFLIESDWEDDEINAHATRDLADNPIVKIPGGLFRHPLLTQDGFILLICHEIGHFLGGAPKIFLREKRRFSWSSAEGQADYFASGKCYKNYLEQMHILKNQETNFGPEKEGIFTLDDLSEVQQMCKTATCQKFAFGALSAAKVLAHVKWESQRPSLKNHDPTEVLSTLDRHSTAQCRLDTFMAGWFCPISHHVPFDDENESIGACHTNNHSNANSNQDENDKSFQRPQCWFKANI